MGFGQSILKVFTLTCADAAKLLSASQDLDLTRAERIALRMHLLICKACRRYRRQLAFIQEAMRKPSASVEPDESGRSLSPEARERIKNSLHQ